MKTFLFLLALAMTFGGGQALYTSLTNLKPLELEVDDFLQKDSSRKWVTVTGAVLDVMDATFISPFYTEEATELYIPIRASEEDTSPIRAFLFTKDPDILAVYNGLIPLEDEVEIINYFIEHRDVFSQNREISGLIRFGIESDQDDRDILRENNEHLAKGFIILDEGAKPEWGMALMLPAGLALFWALFSKKTGGQTTRTSPPPPPPPAPASQP